MREKPDANILTKCLSEEVINTIYENTFKRGEKKFVLNASQFTRLSEAIKDKVVPDEYGRHTVLNIYCDNEYNESILNSISHPVYKEKLRLRCYGVPDDETTTFLEIKKKFKGIVYKRRIELPYADAWDYLYSKKSLDMSIQQAREIDYLKNRMELKPYVFVGYDRIAMIGADDPELRITFDTNIRYRFDDLDLRLGDSGKLLIDEKNGDYVMEIKRADSFPLWLTDILTSEKIYSSSFSKVGNVYKHNYRRNGDRCLQT